jgi:hypothetical protein
MYSFKGLNRLNNKYILILLFHQYKNGNKCGVYIFNL